MPREWAPVLALADDVTGALEVGACLATAGIRTVVCAEARPGPSEAQAVVVNAGTRQLTGPQAALRIRRLAARARKHGVRYLYHKTDSTLRGNVGPELNAVMEAWPACSLVYAPAYPRMGRTVRRGRLLVDGRPLEETPFARDPLAPARTGCLADLLKPHCAAPVALVADGEQLRSKLRSRAAALFVCDAETDRQLAALARVLAVENALTLAAGPAGFLIELAKCYAVSRVPPPARPRAESVLLASGSLHPASREQARNARQAGLAAIETPMPARAPSATSARRAAAHLATEVMEKLATQRVDALIVFGGDTAHAILKAMGVTALDPVGEVLPGIPVSGLRWRGRDLLMVSKAGGFGGPGVAGKIVNALGRPEED